MTSPVGATPIAVTIKLVPPIPADGAPSDRPPRPATAAKSPLSRQHQEQLGRGRVVRTVVADLSYVCEWAPTHLRLSAPRHEPGGCCLPLRLSETSYLRRNMREEEGKDDGHWFESAARLRRAELERYLRAVPPLARSARRLLCGGGGKEDPLQGPGSGPPPCRHRRISAGNAGRVINVLQREIAHCTPRQADVLVSDDATTCHLLALWSRSGGGAVLATMAHVDGPGHGASVRDAFEEHVDYHALALQASPPPSRKSAEDAEECKENCGEAYPEAGAIDMSVHIVGGFDDAEGNSIQITESLLRTLAAAAREHAIGRGGPPVCVTLATCVVAAGNDDGAFAPRGRGLGLAVASGEAFLAEVDGGDAQGPASALRGARLWAEALHGPSNPRCRRRLHVVHRPDSDRLRVEPFFFGPHVTVRDLLVCDDEELREAASTSPDVEKPNFVRQVRESLEYMNRTDSRSVFPENQAVEYARVGLNGWVQV